jgi:hypothetical protein
VPRKDWNILQQFGKLNDNVKEYVVKFSDANATSSSLIKFCVDLPKPLGGGSDVKFIDYVNIEENLNVVKNFVGHKLSDTAFDPVYEETGEEETDNSLVGLAKEWVERSVAWQKTRGYMQDGIDYGNHAAKNLLSLNSSLAQSLGITMSDYYLFREVYLYVNKAEDQYTKADILLVKYNALDQIDNVILLETKISGSTEYTPRQKQSYRIIAEGNGIENFELKSQRGNTIINSQGMLETSTLKALVPVNNVKSIAISALKAYKISDHGLKNGTLEANLIDVNKFKIYIAPDNK